MANAAARRSFCGFSTFFAFVAFLQCFSSVIAVSGHSIVLQKRNVRPHQLAVREVEPGSNFRIATRFTTFTDSVSVTTTLGGGASVASPSSTPISAPKSSASSSFSPSSKASSASIQTTSRVQSTPASTPASSSARSTPLRGDQRPSGSAESFTPSSSALPASKISSATPSSSVLPSQPTAPASVNTPNPTPATTLFAPASAIGFKSNPSFTPSSPIETIPSLTSATPTSTPVVAAAARSSGFFNNKGAVAAVFVIVSLLAAGALIVAFITLRKRYRARKLREDHADLWEKFSNHSHRTRSNSPGPSINAAPLDAFALRDESYIPAEAGSSQQHSTSFHSSTPVQHPDYYPNYPPVFSQQTSSSATSSQAVPPTAFREPVGRASYQQSIDSFYGATGRAL